MRLSRKKVCELQDLVDFFALIIVRDTYTLTKREYSAAIIVHNHRRVTRQQKRPYRSTKIHIRAVTFSQFSVDFSGMKKYNSIGRFHF